MGKYIDFFKYLINFMHLTTKSLKRNTLPASASARPSSVEPNLLCRAGDDVDASLRGWRSRGRGAVPDFAREAPSPVGQWLPDLHVVAAIDNGTSASSRRESPLERSQLDGPAVADQHLPVGQGQR